MFKIAFEFLGFSETLKDVNTSGRICLSGSAGVTSLRHVRNPCRS